MKISLIISLLFTLPFQIMSVTYNYSYYGKVIHSAPGMTYATYFNAQTLGITMSSPEDMAIDDQYIYMVDSGRHSLILIDHQFNHVETYTSFELSLSYQQKLIDAQIDTLEPQTLKNPFGLDVKPSGIYICDSGNHRIIKLNHQFEVIDIFSEIDDMTFDELAFEPRKITVDTTERMYVVARDVYEGIIELNNDGSFNRFTGVNPIKLTPIEIFRRSLMTEAQLAQLQLYLPTGYTNVSINERSFIYATSRPSTNNAENTIQLINPKGVDVIKKNGYHPPMGDIHYISGLNNHVITGPSLLVDITSTKHGIFTVLDQRRSRLFTYDSEGNLLYINGDEGAQSDRFSEGVAIKYLKDDLLVLDRKSRTVVVYRLTEFGTFVNEAIALHSEGKFLEAAEIWYKVLELNTNYEIAYNGIGKFLLREGRFKEAMHYFNLGHDKYYYSKAFTGYRNEILRNNFGYIIGFSVVLASGLIGFKIYKTYKKGGSIFYED